MAHYLKHHPMYEFKNFQEFPVDPYRHWLHGRYDYYNTETYPAEVSPWEKGSKAWHSFYMFFPFLMMFWLPVEFKKHCNNKNVKMPVIGVFSQNSI